MKLNAFGYWFVFIVGILIGCEIGSVLVKSGKFPEHFFEVKFIEILNLVVGVLVASVVTYFVTSQLNMNFGRREFLSQLGKSFQEELSEIHRLGDDLVTGRFPNRNAIMCKFKSASISLGFIEEGYKKSHFKFDESLKTAFWKYKATLTGNLDGRPPFADGDLHAFSDDYSDLCKRLMDVRLQVFF